jgi:hypothetical protein
MQKVVGSNPIIRSQESPGSGGVFALRVEPGGPGKTSIVSL